MSCRGPRSLPGLLMLLLLLLLLLLQVNLVHGSQWERESDDLADQTKGQGHQPLRRSKRRWVITTLELEEEDPGPFPKLVGELFHNTYDNAALKYVIRGPGVDEDPEAGLFSLDGHEEGKVYAHRPVRLGYEVYLDAVTRSTGQVVDSSLIFSIRIRDVNDHAPRFPEEEFAVVVREGHAAGQTIFQMSAVDLDQENTPNSQVVYFLVSQTPLTKESGFKIDRNSGEIRLSGCLRYEAAPQFTLLIRAADCGDPPLSATATVHVSVQGGNRHRPQFTQENYEIQVPEGRVSPDVLRLRVRDGDASAWRARFHIASGNEEGHFAIVTDSKTNEGVLSVIKALDHEARPTRSLVVAVETGEQLFSCEGGELRTPREAAASATVTVQVADANEPPAFHPRSFVVSEVDGAGPGTRLGTFKATDPDGGGGQMRYKLVHDPARWVTVDERSGVVVTKKQVDRESPYVNDSFYTIVAQAVDDGHPPQTGTGTLVLFLSDVNDNAPTLHPRSRFLEVCEPAAATPLLLEAEDGDLEPYAHPFTFELDPTWGNAEHMWKLGRNRGRSVELLMLRSLPRGRYVVPLSIADRQGLARKQTVHVRVCACPGGSMCAVEPSATGPGALVGVLGLAAALLLLLRCRCGPEATRPGGPVPRGGGQQTLIAYNNETRAAPAQPGIPQLGSEVSDQMSALPINTAEVEERSRLGAEVYPAAAGGPRRPLEVRAGVMAELLHQKLCGLAELAEDPGSQPHIYSEEGDSD